MGNKIMMIVIIALLVVLIGAVGFVAVYGLRVLQETSQQGDNPPPVRILQPLTQKDIHLVKFPNQIVANLKKGADGRERAAQLTLSLEIDNTDAKESPEIIALLQDREPVIRDIVFNIMRNMTHDQLIEIDEYNGIDELKNNILNALKVEFATNLIVNVRTEVLWQ